MIVLFATKDISRFSKLVDTLWNDQAIELAPTATGSAGLALLNGTLINLVIVDEQLDDMSGITFVKQLVKINPLVNTAIVSTLPADEFHEATEGLGVLMQLPLHPSAIDAEALMAVLEKIGALMQTAEQPPPEAANS